MFGTHLQHRFPMAALSDSRSPSPRQQALQALEAGSVSSLPDAVRTELEDVEQSGGLKHLQEVAQQVKV